jgi:hypothetical protein
LRFNVFRHYSNRLANHTFRESPLQDRYCSPQDDDSRLNFETNVPSDDSFSTSGQYSPRPTHATQVSIAGSTHPHRIPQVVVVRNANMMQLRMKGDLPNKISGIAEHTYLAHARRPVFHSTATKVMFLTNHLQAKQGEASNCAEWSRCT